MNIIIVGAGKVGMTLVDFFSGEEHNITIVDINTDIAKEVINRYDVSGVSGNGASCAVLKDAGADKADMLIAVASTDELNLLICMTAKEMGVAHTIARVRNPEYYEQTAFICNRLGITMVVNPELEAAQEITRIVQFPSAMKVDAFAKGKVDIAEIHIAPSHPLIGMRICDIRRHSSIEVLVCTIKRKDEIIIPSGEVEIMEGDTAYIIASHGNLYSFFKALNLLKKRIRSVMLIGGSKIAYYLAAQLLKINISVKIIELNPQRCEELAILLPHAVIINADGTDGDILVDEGIDDVDACVSLTNIDEENIIVSMFAQSRQVGKVITKITRMSLVTMMPSVGIESSIISPKSLVANSIVRYVRGISDSMGSSNIETLYKMIENRVEAIEFKVTSGLPFAGTPLKELKLKPNILIGCISRGREIICPSGASTIEVGDRVVVITSNAGLGHLEDILI